MIRKWLSLSVAAGVVLGVAACSGSGTPGALGGSVTPSGQARFVNAISDSPVLTASVTGSSLSLPNIAFLTDSGLLDEPAGTYTVQIQPTGGGSQVNLTMNTVHVDEGFQTTLFALGRIASNNLKTLAVERQVGSVPSGMTEVQFVDTTTTSNGPHIAIYVAPPGQSLGAALGIIASPTTGASHPPNTPLLQVASGTMRIQLNSDHENGLVIFDTGDAGFNFPSGGSLQFVLVDAPNAQPSPEGARVQLMVLDNNGGATQVLQNTAQ